ncbi:ras association domain-containing protein 2-like [Asterias rubens]|uniref:ras association domain-containing protein 2-like n=1 Tax=Asterias rubens TaxID=7604 RepID=UPI0014557F15|nr:ras association domain-containing protein 2-like [Asterias rubens]
MDSQEVEEHRDRMYKTIVQSSSFALNLKTFNIYFSDSKLNQQLQIVQENGVYILFGMLKIYWGTQKVIRLKKEELSWKRKTTRLGYDSGLDEKLMSAMGSGAKNRRSLTRQHESLPEFSANDGNDHDSQDDQERTQNSSDTTARRDRNSDAGLDYWNKQAVKRNDDKRSEKGDTGEEDEENTVDESFGRMGLSVTMPRKCNLQRRTMSFSGHLYNSKTAVFRPKYGTISNVRVSSRQTTSEVISMLLKKFAVENVPEEFSLFWVLQHGETHAFQPNDFPLLKRVQLGPDENVAKIFIKEKKAGEVSPEVAQYVNLQFSELQAILRKFQEEEEKEVLKIKQRYSQYKANLQKKISLLPVEVVKESKSQTKHKGKIKKKGKDKGKDKKKK